MPGPAEHARPERCQPVQFGGRVIAGCLVRRGHPDNLGGRASGHQNDLARQHFCCVRGFVRWFGVRDGGRRAGGIVGTLARVVLAGRLLSRSGRLIRQSGRLLSRFGQFSCSGRLLSRSGRAGAGEQQVEHVLISDRSGAPARGGRSPCPVRRLGRRRAAAPGAPAPPRARAGARLRRPAAHPRAALTLRRPPGRSGRRLADPPW